MSKKLIKDLEAFCNKVKEILKENSEREFRQLKLRDREAIQEKFKDLFTTEYNEGLVLNMKRYKNFLTPSLYSYLSEIKIWNNGLILTTRRELDTIDEIERFLEIIQNTPKKQVTLLNCAILTTEGNFSLKKTSIEDVKSLIEDVEIQSAIGHQSTAEILSELLGIDIPVNIIQYEQKTGDTAIVFKLRSKTLEGKILTREEIEEIGYEFYFLEKREIDN